MQESKKGKTQEQQGKNVWQGNAYTQQFLHGANAFWFSQHGTTDGDADAYANAISRAHGFSSANAVSKAISATTISDANVSESNKLTKEHTSKITKQHEETPSTDPNHGGTKGQKTQGRKGVDRRRTNGCHGHHGGNC